ncbi:MAG: diacylglycerol kinase [Parcubacteria group bacterium Gr01-1014_31]|nr:MAG: diacylglycerol kinase [Parcubacteria group bacterium Gr01-1014_31]
MPFSFEKFVMSLRRASAAVMTALREEQNFRFQVIAGVVAVAGSIWLGVDSLELAIVIAAAAAVPAMELVNSAAERLVDMAQPRVHHYAAAVKNMMAGAVLITASAAALVILLVVWPYLVAAP